jgi:hypothetical protein
MEQFLESIQPAQQFGAVSTGILPSQVAVMGTKSGTTEDAEKYRGKPFSATDLH